MAKSTTNPAYRDATYQANRLLVLAVDETGEPPRCHWCKRRRATEADHLVSLIDGGDHELDNLVPACKPCNALRGSATARRRKPPSPRPVAKKTNGRSPFLMPSGLHPAASRARSLRVVPDPKPPRPVVADAALIGRDAPRLVTKLSGGTRSRVKDIEACWRRAGGDPLMVWQRLALAGITAWRVKAKRWFHRYGLVTVARQNGKSTAVEALVVWWLAEYVLEAGHQVVTITTHDLRLTSILFDRIMARLAILDVLDGRPLMSHGRQRLRTVGGGELHVMTAAANAGHGLSVDLAVVDELWDVEESCVDQGLVPAQRARPNPLMVMVSTAGTETSSLFRRWREHGLRTIDTGRPGPLFFAEWSPPPGADPADPDTWTWANPALGQTITPAALQLEAEAPNRAAFLRASLNLWVATIGGWLSPGVWEALERPGPLPPGGMVACDTSQDAERWVAVRAAPDANGSLGVEVAFVADSEPAFWTELAALIAATGCAVALTPGLDSHKPLDMATVTVGFSEIRLWTALVRSAITQGAVWHTGQHALAEQVARAVASYMDGGIALSSAKSRGAIELARCLVFAVGAALRPVAPAAPAPAFVAASRS